ncbi:MAG: carboxypeptidase-like regulatory domain-containing protein [Xanthomonadales bacterium]|nr:carboxypeptidase-like regulatory domain-containing protein [Xanthomonadales bacterium]
MKKWLILALVLVGLVAGILLLGVENNPSDDLANSDAGEELAQHEKKTLKLPLDQGDRSSKQKDSVKHPSSSAEQVNSNSPSDAPASEPRKSARVGPVDSDFWDDEEPELFYIGGLVQDEDGIPQPNVEVLVERLSGSDGVLLLAKNVQSIFTDLDGGFLFGELEDGEYLVRLAPVEGIAPSETTVRAGTLNVRLVLVLQWDFRIYGTVSSTDGKPIDDVQIITSPTTHRTTSGSKGEYELDIAMRGIKFQLSIYFEHEDYRKQRIRINPADLDDLGKGLQLDVEMEPINKLTTVSGNLRDTEGSPVVGEALNILTSRSQTKHRTQSDVNGNYYFERVEPGEDYKLSIRPGSKYRNKDISPLVVPDDGLELDIVLELTEQGELSGWMIDLDGNPVSGFFLTLYSTIASGQSVSVTGDQEGFFSVKDFPIGGALFRTNSYPVLTVKGMYVSPEPEEPVTVVLDTGLNVLQGQVINMFSEPVVASSITLMWDFSLDGVQSASIRKTTTDLNGGFLFTGLGPGLHTMRVSAEGFNDAVLTIETGVNSGEIIVELDEVPE